MTFSEPVTLPANPATAFLLERVADPSAGPQVGEPLGSVNLSGMQSPNNTAVTLTFLSGGAVPVQAGTNSLIDGRYRLTVIATKVTGQYGVLDGNRDGFDGDNYVLDGGPTNRLFRLFGDADGDGDVDGTDQGLFRAAMFTTNADFDYDGDGDVDTQDFKQFRDRFGAFIPFP